MNYRVYLLAFIAFAAGIDENIIVGIISLVASDLNVTVSTAGQLTSIFSIVFAICAPLLLTCTASYERRNLLQITVLIFALSNLIAAMSINYEMLLCVRIISAASCSLIIVLATTIASCIVPDSHKGRAIGFVFMGISGSLVLGVPFGILLSSGFGWRAPFIFIAIIALLLGLSIRFVFPTIEPKPAIPFSKYWLHLKNRKMASGQLISILMIGGHFTLYAYLLPYVQKQLHVTDTMMSVVLLLFGISAVFGGYIGGLLSDQLGRSRAVVLIPSLFFIFLVILPFMTTSLFWFLPFMMIWSCISWMISPAVQNYLIHNDPKNGDVAIGVNTSAMHIGVAIGSGLGGLVIMWSSIDYNAWVGSLVVVLSILCALYSTSRTQAYDTSPVQQDRSIR
ncbi:MAG TPA: MFS transporter [Bacillus bacterium]|uniref:Chloramphenicol resistance protein n=1 Tax=Siminovitchia fordii TaxID=254759 RepID=A0ABQ4K147_9BACI|nr:MFS transporter [Siminovitchia fordii]GIN18872.1 chloramphenicol resistance protein [Siminovitchia fordii]HBZ10510.1 MFS transporter [Bacillus sp. (in: firmicutes)]